ncbi:ParA-like protein [hydrothermal vent metagenome]|uniref:ParA-like protein n=1 Tax=hydrothermal vent metagenome TaxID=652676 RepID=A0A3B0WSK5_9ZZZZ
MNIFAVANQKGGVGKTTTTVTLGGILAKKNSRTLLVDLDPHGSLSSYLGIDPEAVDCGVYQLFQQVVDGSHQDMSRLIHETDFENLFILPASTAMATLERQLGSKNGMGLVLKRVLNTDELPFDTIIIDCPPMMGLLMINALACCERIIIPVQTEHLAIKGMERMLRSVKMIQNSLNVNLAYTILPTMYDQRTSACKESLQHLQYEHNRELSDVVIPIDTRLRDASHIGKPISHMSGDSQALRAYEKLVGTLTCLNNSVERSVA